VLFLASPVSDARESTEAASSPRVAHPPHSAAKKLKGFPTQRTAGVPLGWSPKRTINGSYNVNKAGAVIKDVRVFGDVNINARNVTLRRVDVVGGVIQNWVGSTCYTGLTVKRTTIRRAPGQATTGDFPALSTGGYVARRVAILGLPEGFRVGGASGGCGPVKIVNSYAKVTAPTICGDWHGDTLQGYDGADLDLRNSTLRLVEREDCGGTAPFFYADGGNGTVTINGLLVAGGGFSFRLGMPGTVTGLHIEKGSYSYGPISVVCDILSTWSADLADVRSGQPQPERSQRCNTDES
jgi:hypothetical protein